MGQNHTELRNSFRFHEPFDSILCPVNHPPLFCTDNGEFLQFEETNHGYHQAFCPPLGHSTAATGEFVKGLFPETLKVRLRC